MLYIVHCLLYISRLPSALYRVHCLCLLPVICCTYCEWSCVVHIVHCSLYISCLPSALYRVRCLCLLPVICCTYCTILCNNNNNSHLTQRLTERLAHLFADSFTLRICKWGSVERQNLLLLRLQSSTHLSKLQNPFSLHTETILAPLHPGGDQKSRGNHAPWFF